jgi:hypothetical protein
MKMINIKKKKGELSSEQIIVLAVLIMSFLAILFFIFRMEFGKESNMEVCHNSVVMRGSSVIPTDAVPLKCSREYVCLTKDGSCEGMTKSTIIKVKTKDELYGILAEQMANCWWEFGEGKINYVTSTMTKNNYCSICSQLFFDNSLNEIEGIDKNISKDEFYNYLSFTTVPNKNITYSKYFFGTDDISTLREQISNQAGKEVSFGDIKVGGQYFVVMGITSQVKAITWVLGGTAIGGMAVIGLATAGIGTAAFLAVVAGDVAGGAIGKGVAGISGLFSPQIGAIVVDGEGIKNKFMAPTIQGANSDEFKLLNCEDIVTST